MAYLDDRRIGGRWTALQVDEEGKEYIVCGRDLYFGTTTIMMDLRHEGSVLLLSDRGQGKELADTFHLVIDTAALSRQTCLKAEVFMAGDNITARCRLPEAEAVDGFSRLVHNAPDYFKAQEA